MPTVFEPATPIHGIAMESMLGGEVGTICNRANLSSEDGAAFLNQIESLWGYFRPYIAVRPSLIDNFLAILPSEGPVTAYCNELNRLTLVRSKGAIEAGQRISKDHIADINEVQFQTADGTAIELPTDSGLVIIFSHDWRKSLFYDLSPLAGPKRTIDIAKLLGRQLSGMMFQELYSINDVQWKQMIDWGWFPFIGLSDADRRKLIAFSNRDDEPRQVYYDVCKNYRPTIGDRIDSWRSKNILQDHIPFLDSGLVRLLDDDFITCISTIYPRIEGVMRSLALIENPVERTGQSKMVDNLVGLTDDNSLLLPRQFKQYLTSFYFRSFNYVEGKLPLSRHTVGHGLSKAEDCDLVNATLGFLIFDQLFYYLR